MIGVHQDVHAVGLGQLMDMHGAGNSAGNGCPLPAVAQALAGVEGCAAVRELNDHRGVHFAGRLQSRVDGVRAGAVDSRQRKPVRFCVGEHLLHIVADDDANRRQIL